MKKKLLTAQEVQNEIGICANTLSLWYRFKKKNPENEYAKLLPEIIYEPPHNARKWKRSDLTKLKKFKDSIPHGKNGVLGSVTQCYYKKQKTKEKETVYE